MTLIKHTALVLAVATLAGCTTTKPVVKAEESPKADVVEKKAKPEPKQDSIGALVADMQKQVYLCRRQQGLRHQPVSPLFSFCCKVAFSLSSGPNVKAWSH